MEELPLSPVVETFVKNVRGVLASKGMSANELARRLSVNSPGINRLLMGKRIPRIDTLADIAAALGVEPFELLKPMPADPPASKKPGKK